MIRVLIACEESQSELKFWYEGGFDAWSCDIQECSGPYPERHIQGNVLDLDLSEFDLVIAHPPCTYLTSAGSYLLFNKDHSIRDFGRLVKCKEAAWFFKWFWNQRDKIKHLCIENPRPMKIAGLPEYTQETSPHYFGSYFSKRTCYWLHNLPPLMSTCIHPHPRSYVYSCFGSKALSKSFDCISEQMFIQWSPFLV